jgi:ElaB/YqjD/DUF883 family membrane-anchored ribosome-binding protein
MADQRNSDLPEGTDTVMEGANLGAITTDPTSKDESGQTITIEGTSANDERTSGSGSSDGRNSITNSSSSSEGNGEIEGGSEGLTDRIRNGGERLANQAGDKARGLVGQGLERTSEALANVAKMVGDTAAGIDERLGSEYGDYARRAAGSIENVANAIAEKDPEELIEDTREFVRNSPGIAMAGAAVIGFVVARLVKSGLSASRNEQDDRA